MLINENEALRSLVSLELQRELLRKRPAHEAVERLNREVQPWPERRRFWHRRWPLPADVAMPPSIGSVGK